MAQLTREQILKVQDLKKKTINIPEWGGDVTISEMSGEARDRWEQSIINGGKASLNNVRAKLAAASIVDDAGNLMFKESDIKILANKSSAALDKVMVTAQKLNSLFDNDLEELAKN